MFFFGRDGHHLHTKKQHGLMIYTILETENFRQKIRRLQKCLIFWDGHHLHAKKQTRTCNVSIVLLSRNDRLSRYSADSATDTTYLRNHSSRQSKDIDDHERSDLAGEGSSDRSRVFSPCRLQGSTSIGVPSNSVESPATVIMSGPFSNMVTSRSDPEITQITARIDSMGSTLKQID